MNVLAVVMAACLIVSSDSAARSLLRSPVLTIQPPTAHHAHLVEFGRHSALPQTGPRSRAPRVRLSQVRIRRAACVHVQRNIATLFPVSRSVLPENLPALTSRATFNPLLDTGLLTVPTRIILGVAPVNALLNYLLGASRERSFYNIPALTLAHRSPGRASVGP